MKFSVNWWKSSLSLDWKLQEGGAWIWISLKHLSLFSKMLNLFLLSTCPILKDMCAWLLTVSKLVRWNWAGQWLTLALGFTQFFLSNFWVHMVHWVHLRSIGVCCQYATAGKLLRIVCSTPELPGEVHFLVWVVLISLY